MVAGILARLIDDKGVTHKEMVIPKLLTELQTVHIKRTRYLAYEEPPDYIPYTESVWRLDLVLGPEDGGPLAIYRLT